MADFKQALKVVLSHEGGYVDNPEDRGGETNRGITQKCLDAFNSKRKYPFFSVEKLSEADAAEIYREYYWNPLQCEHLDDQKLATAIFDLGVLAGVQSMVKNIQKALGIAVDGKMGPHTALSLQSEATLGSDAFLATLLRAYEHYFLLLAQANPSQKQFLQGWQNRVRSLA